MLNGSYFLPELPYKTIFRSLWYAFAITTETSSYSNGILKSVMGFILPDKFGDEVAAHLRAIFKVKGDTKLLLAEERVKRAKTMMTPFVLRRRKDQVGIALLLISNPY